jgi:hypothetical protein
LRRLLSITLVLTLATAASACGGDDDESSGPEDFGVQADAICEEVNRESPPPTEAPRSAQEAIDLETDEIEIRQGLDARLRELQPPEHLQTVFDDYNAQTAEVIDLNEQARQAAEDGDEKRYGEVGQQRLEALEARERTAEQLGFEVCGRQMEASPEAAPSEPVPPDER